MKKLLIALALFASTHSQAMSLLALEKALSTTSLNDITSITEVSNQKSMREQVSIRIDGQTKKGVPVFETMAIEQSSFASKNYEVTNYNRILVK